MCQARLEMSASSPRVQASNSSSTCMTGGTFPRAAAAQHIATPPHDYLYFETAGERVVRCGWHMAGE